MMQKITLLSLLVAPGLTFAGIVGPGPSPAPEPSTIALFASGAAAAGLIGYLKKKRSK
jgi:hypothetical protein